jgi:hypothetical protein
MGSWGEEQKKKKKNPRERDRHNNRVRGTTIPEMEKRNILLFHKVPFLFFAPLS